MYKRLNTEFLGVKLKTPLVLLSGIMGVSYSGLLSAVENGAGIVTLKSLTLNPREGHKGPVIAEYKAGLINSMGLCNQGIQEGIKEASEFKEHSQIPLIISVFGTTPEEFEELTKYVNKSKADFLELNLSCPNVSSEYGTPISASKEKVYEIIKCVKKLSKLPVIAKLSPNTHNVKDIAMESKKAGADGLTLINTLGPGMLIDIKAKRPVLYSKFGGISGPAIKPIAIKLIYEIHKEIKIPIIGSGGITNGEDAIEMLMAGANLIGVGSGVYYRGIEVFNKINREIIEFLDENNYNSIGEIKPIN